MLACVTHSHIAGQGGLLEKNALPRDGWRQLRDARVD